MSKQDRVYTRTAADLERKYKLGTPSNGGGDSQEVSKLSQLLSQFMTSTGQKFNVIEEKLKNIGKPSAEDVSYASSSLSATNVQDAIDELEEELEQKGDGGIYIGSGEMPEDCNVQIDPNGEIEEYVLKSEYDAKVAKYDVKVKSLENTITSLQTTKTGAITDLIGDANRNVVIRTGNVVTVQFRSGATAVAHGTKIAQLPEGFRPSSGCWVFGQAYIASNGTMDAGIYVIDSNGYINQEINSGQTCYHLIIASFIV